MSDTTAAVSAAPTLKMPSVLGGAMIVAGTSIGAGMFALPVYSAGMWFTLSIVMLAVCWFCAYSSSMFLAEAGLNYRDGANYSSIAEDTLGPVGKLVATTSVGFVLFILCYAYISGGSSVVAQTAGSMGLELSSSAASLIFAAVVSAIVIAGSRMVDRVSTIMLGGMVLTFFSSTGMMAGEASSANLFPAGVSVADNAPYILIAIPMLVTSFGFHGTVFSLVKHYQKDIGRVRMSMLVGTVLTLLVYVFWQLAIMGNVSREQFVDIIADGGNVATLISAVGQSTDVSGVESALMVFGNLALASSFIGVALGLLDLVKDVLKLDDSRKGTLIAGAVTFLPPAVLGAIWPHGFITAIGFAALAAVVFVLILPPLMARALRKRGDSKQFQTAGGALRLNIVLLAGVFAFLVEIAHLLGLLPQFG